MTVDITILFHAVLKTAIPIAAGVIAAKIGIFEGDFSKRLADLILKICQPVLIITSIMSVEYSPENLVTGLTVLLATAVAHAVMFAGAFLSTRPIKDRKERAVTEYCMIFANVGFFGFPVVKSIYGNTGLFWGGFYYIFFNIAMWSYGQLIYSRGSGGGRINVRRILLNAGTVPCVIGFALYLARVRIYAPVFESLEALGDVCSPVSMILVGAMLTRSPVKKLVSSPTTWYTALFRLIVFPVLCGTVVRLAGFSEEISMFIVIMTSLPAATASAMFAESYDVLPEQAARNVGITTLLSVATVPGTTFIASQIMKLF